MLYPFRRILARIIDYLVWGMIAVVVTGDAVGNLHSPSWKFYGAFWVYTVVEAALISAFGTTFGKYLTGISVYDRNGGKLSFARSLQRAFLVFGAGAGFFLPYVSAVLPLYALYKLLKNHTLFWDGIVDDHVAQNHVSVWGKAAFFAFCLFVGGGYFLTARLVVLHDEPDFAAAEDSILTSYFENIRPAMVGALSEDAVLTPEAAGQAVDSLKTVQVMLNAERDKLYRFRDEIGRKIAAMPVPELRERRQKQLNAFVAKTDSFLFAERMRVSLFQNILSFFKSEEDNDYTVVAGRPVFTKPEMARQYDNYMTQLETFLTLPFGD